MDLRRAGIRDVDNHLTAMARFDPRLRRGCPSSPLVSERVVVSRPVVPGEKGCLLPIHSHSSKPHG